MAYKPVPWTEWKMILHRFNDCCAACKRSKEVVGNLQQAHLFPISRGGTNASRVPMCPNCHAEYDRCQLSSWKLENLRSQGVDSEVYRRGGYLPAGRYPISGPASSSSGDVDVVGKVDSCGRLDDWMISWRLGR